MSLKSPSLELTTAAVSVPADAQTVLDYHQRTKHRMDRHAAGPETLDWSEQPDPYRVYEGCSRTALSLSTGHLDASFAQIHTPQGLQPRPLTLESVGALLALSMCVSAWKEHGPDRWAVRCNPSSGNLHPTEAYVLSEGIPGLADGVHHYVSRDHVLEQRCTLTWAHAGPARPPALWLALSSVHWREAWKYGERAWRYCQLDAGHAVGTLAYAAAVLGWSVRLVDTCDDAALARLLGLDRGADYGAAEREHPDLLLAVLPTGDPSRAQVAVAERLMPAGLETVWAGRANVLDRHPMYHWPVIDEVSQATRMPPTVHARDPDQRQRTARTPEREPSLPAVALLQGRRSAQRFDRKHTMSDKDFFRLLESLSPRHALPWHVWRARARIHPLIFVHRVSGLVPGIYALSRHLDAERLLVRGLHKEFLWRRVENAPRELPLMQLFPGDFRQAARTLSCHQAIAGDSAFSLAMLAEFGPRVRAEPWRYRQLFWEAGLLGQVLYLQAENLGLRGTGIGCYFDDAVHELLGIANDELQSLYHFTVGRALVDEHICTLPHPSQT